MDFPPNLHILHGRAGGRAWNEVFIHFPCPALFPHLPEAVSWAGDAFVSTLPTPLTPAPGSVPWQWGEYTSDKKHISGKAVCAHVWLPLRKKRKRNRKKRRGVPFFHQTMETSSFVRADGFPIDSMAEASFMCTAEPQSPPCAALQRGERKPNH